MAELPPAVPSPIWLSHHWPSEYDRCATVAGLRVCRRCLVLYPTAVVAAVLALVGVTWPDRFDPVLLWLLPVPAVVEFVAENLGWVRHSPPRLIAFTFLLALACGKLYARYLDDTRDPLVWSVVVTYAAVCLGAVLWKAFRPQRVPS
jgi:hypothetical protein